MVLYTWEWLLFTHRMSSSSSSSSLCLFFWIPSHFWRCLRFPYSSDLSVLMLLLLSVCIFTFVLHNSHARLQYRTMRSDATIQVREDNSLSIPKNIFIFIFLIFAFDFLSQIVRSLFLAFSVSRAERCNWITGCLQFNIQ